MDEKTNERFEDVVAEMRIFKCRNLATGELEGCPTTRAYFADRLEAAYKRDVKELCECLKEAIDVSCARCNVSRGMNCDGKNIPFKSCLPQKWRNVIEGANDKSRGTK